MKRNNKRALYENIMRNVAKEVKRILNENISIQNDTDFDIEDTDISYPFDDEDIDKFTLNKILYKVFNLKPPRAFTTRERERISRILQLEDPIKTVMDTAKFYILIEYFGLYNKHQRSIEELADIYNVTESRINYVINSALRDIRKYMKNNNLEHNFDIQL